ncbi:MAG: class I SAM-dependent methyltransferase [Sandaracinaceae bacterium]
MEAHYDAFPYPDPRELVPPRSPRHAAGVLSYLARRRPNDALSDTPRVWVAGCGTQQASTWALTFPDSHVLGTDVSEVTLHEARRVAAHVGAAPELARRDLREAPGAAEAFDLIVSTGVVHHLEDPAAGLAHLARALRPGGMMILMVYSATHRAPLTGLRAAARRLSKGTSDPLAVALDVLRASLAERCEPVTRGLAARMLEIARESPSFVADVLLHPVEHHYDIDRLHRLLEAAGLRFTEWLFPAAWSLRRYVSTPSLLAMASSFDPRAQAQTVLDVAGLASPLLEVVVERADTPARPPYSREERLAMPLLLSPGSRRLSLRDRTVEPIPSVSETESGLVGTARAGVGAGTTFQIHPSMKPLLDACDGTPSLDALLARFGTPSTRESLFRSLTELLPHEVGLLAPAWGD